jgi:hypothetical protein
MVLTRRSYRPSSRAKIGEKSVEHFASDVALEAPQDLTLDSAVGGPARRVARVRGQ